ncbi:MAG: Universal stress protein family [Spirosoma sp.]|nr:Universal stress protein family [Spirosoma sp.]
MKKILVTTEFSANSRAALRFAIQLASQSEVALTFLHVKPVMRLTVSDGQYVENDPASQDNAK